MLTCSSIYTVLSVHCYYGRHCTQFFMLTVEHIKDSKVSYSHLSVNVDEEVSQLVLSEDLSCKLHSGRVGEDAPSLMMLLFRFLSQTLLFHQIRLCNL